MSTRLVLPFLGVLGVVLAGSTHRADEQRRELVYVAIGASDTVGVGAENPTEEGWVYVLHRYMPPGTSLVNLGVSGIRLESVVDEILPVAIDANPDVVTVWLAVNDLRGGVDLRSYARDLDVLLARLREAGAEIILVGNIPDLTLLPAFAAVGGAAGGAAGDPPGSTDGAARAVAQEVERWNSAIAEVTAQHGAVLVDIHAQSGEMAEHPEWIAPDGGHPSAAGYRRLADAYWQALQAGGGLPS